MSALERVPLGPIEAELRAQAVARRLRLFTPRLVPMSVAFSADPEPEVIPDIPNDEWAGPLPAPYDAGPIIHSGLVLNPGSYDAAVLAKNPFHWRRIIEEVAKKHGLRVVDLVSPRRGKEIVRARHEAMWRLRNETAMSMPAIGRKLGGKDHTTVMNGITKHEARIASGEAE